MQNSIIPIRSKKRSGSPRSRQTFHGRNDVSNNGNVLENYNTTPPQPRPRRPVRCNAIVSQDVHRKMSHFTEPNFSKEVSRQLLPPERRGKEIKNDAPYCTNMANFRDGNLPREQRKK